MSGAHAEEALEKFGHDNWIEMDKTAGYLWLGIRTVMELKTWLEDSFHDSLKECVLCSDPVLRVRHCLSKLTTGRVLFK